MGAALTGVVALGLVFAPWISAYDPAAVEVGPRLSAPSPQHPLGTDELGRDLLSRLVYGGRVTLRVALGTVLLSATTGSLAGIWLGYRGGRWDAWGMRLVDVALTFPALVLAMGLAAALGPSLYNAMLAVAAVQFPRYVRLMRGEALRLRQREFVEAAHAIGAGEARVLFRHLLPNALPVLLAYATLGFGESTLAVASLSFLGLGAQPPTPEWGALVNAGRAYLLDQWWYAAAPGVALFVTVTGLNLLGDALRQHLDPKMR
ncbi:MAG: ABC transporter permease [Bacillota bacterium]